jgi:hypothetical protein
MQKQTTLNKTMTANSAIGFSYDNRIMSVYCHYEGYLEGVGATLYHFYKSPSKIMRLLQNGWISTLQPTIEETVFYKDTQPNIDYKPVISPSEKHFLARWNKVSFIYLYHKAWYIRSNNKWEKVEV